MKKSTQWETEKPLQIRGALKGKRGILLEVLSVKKLSAIWQGLLLPLVRVSLDNHNFQTSFPLSVLSCEFVMARSFPWGHELHLISGLSALTSSYVPAHWSPAQPQFCLCLSPLNHQRVTSQLDLGMESSLGTCPVITGLATLRRPNPSLLPLLICIDFPDWPWTCLITANFPDDSNPWLILTMISKPALWQCPMGTDWLAPALSALLLHWLPSP